MSTTTGARAAPVTPVSPPKVFTVTMTSVTLDTAAAAATPRLTPVLASSTVSFVTASWTAGIASVVPLPAVPAAATITPAPPAAAATAAVTSPPTAGLPTPGPFSGPFSVSSARGGASSPPTTIAFAGPLPAVVVAVAFAVRRRARPTVSPRAVAVVLVASAVFATAAVPAAP